MLPDEYDIYVNSYSRHAELHARRGLLVQMLWAAAEVLKGLGWPSYVLCYLESFIYDLLTRANYLTYLTMVKIGIYLENYQQNIPLEQF